jgi:hypothetical protein
MSASLTLYERTADLEAVHSWLMESGGELTPEIEERLDAAEGAFDEKAERVALKIREMEATARAVKEEADRLAARVRSMENGARSLKEYLRMQMERADRPEIKRPLVTIRVHRSPPSARCLVPLQELDDHFVRLIPERFEFDAKAALAAHKAGEALPAGVEIVQGHHVRLY